MEFSIAKTITWSWSNDITKIKRVLSEITSKHELVACDFETASKWTDEEKVEMKALLKVDAELSDDDPNKLCKAERILLNQYSETTGLSHPSLTYVTHFSIAWSEDEAFVAVCDTDAIRKLVFRWLVNTSIKQIWHNLSFDGKIIHYHTGKLPKNYEDTEILSRCLLNDVNTEEAKSGLKWLMGYKYGDWAVSKDNFNLANLYDEELIKYAGIDSCATFSLWNEIQESLKVLRRTNA